MPLSSSQCVRIDLERRSKLGSMRATGVAQFQALVFVKGAIELFRREELLEQISETTIHVQSHFTPYNAIIFLSMCLH